VRSLLPSPFCFQRRPLSWERSPQGLLSLLLRNFVCRLKPGLVYVEKAISGLESLFCDTKKSFLSFFERVTSSHKLSQLCIRGGEGFGMPAWRQHGQLSRRTLTHKALALAADAAFRRCKR